MTLLAVVEGDTDIPIVRALAKSTGFDEPEILDMAGKSKLDERLDGYNAAAQGSPWFVLRDLDNDAPCVPDYLNAISFNASEWMVFRIAVREVESWLLADARALSAFLHVSESRIPVDPDAEVDPTRTLVNLARRSTRRRISEAMVPSPGASAQVGPSYEATIIEFAEDHWSLDRACKRSSSLARTRSALKRMAGRWAQYVEGR